MVDKYVRRDGQGNIVALSEFKNKKEGFTEFVKDAVIWLDLQDAKLEAMAATDKDMPRIVEDMWQIMVDKGLVYDADLPRASQDKLINRKAKRAALNA